MNSRIEAVPGIFRRASHLAADAGNWFAGNFGDILLAAGIGFLIAIVLIGLRSLGCRLMVAREGRSQWADIIGRVLAKTSITFIIACSAELVAGIAATPAPVMRAIHVLFVVAAAFQVALWVRELVLTYIRHRVGPGHEQSTLGSALNLIRLLVTITLFAIATIVILANLGVNVTGLVAGLGIGGIAIGLAAQGIFSDLFAALSIIFDKPFRRGDGIKLQDVQGTVEDIGLKTTRIRSISGEQIILSNAKLLEQQIHNFTLLEHRRFTLLFGIVYQTPPDVCAQVPVLLKELVETQEGASFVRCGFTGFGASSLDFELQFDVQGSDFVPAFNARSAIGLAMLAMFNERGIEFAYPTQTSFTAAPDGRFVLPYAPPDESGGSPPDTIDQPFDRP